MKLRYGTRGSPLALAQSDLIAEQLKRLEPSLEIERVVIRTSGDRFAQLPDSALPLAEEGASKGPVNVKAMFVKEIEEALLSGSIDFAVHSAKDLPGDIPDGLEIAAYPEREDPRDVYIGGPKAPHWEDVPSGAVIGTASLRRQIQLTIAKPGISFFPLRGNIDTRLKRLEENKVGAIVLAKAGLKRLGREQTPHQVLPVEVIIPAPGQGALAVEARSGDSDILQLLARIDDPRTRVEVGCERLFLKAMGGGCQTPLGAYAQAELPAEKHMEASLRLSVFWSDMTGKNHVRRSGTCSANPERMEAFVQDVAGQIRKAFDGERK